ncbi:MAG TPA: sialidase family protein [Opitutaceae bacterium]|nr:sialidase family protein [Opitutaceae bacterium]
MIQPLLSQAVAGFLLTSVISSTLAAADSAKPIDPYNVPVAVKANNHPETLQQNRRVSLKFGPEQLIIPGGLQPSMLVTKTGARVVQSQMPERPFPSNRQASNWAMGTYISRDEGKNWKRLPLTPGENGLNMEGGAIQLRDGLILALDTFVTPGPTPEIGLGQIYLSRDDWKTLEGPIEAVFHLPGVVYSGSSDDAGRPYQAARAHRRIIELPNGDLLTTLYGWFKGDEARSGYMPTMKKTRVFLVRSPDRGRTWNLVSTVAVGPDIGTEGYGEAVLERIRKGPLAGRLLCQMRTGRELRETYSDDEGKTWVPAYPRVFADLDVYRTEKWVEMFRGALDKQGRPIDNNPVELIGAVVDPDLLVLRSGIIVATFGVRVPPRACWPRAEHPWNGNYLAISLDDGKTWDHVVRLNSGVRTTHYTAIEETPTDNQIYLAYDLGDWRSGQGRSTYGRTVDISLKAVH